MLCPDCNHKLNPITLPTTKSKVALDYCRFCAGIWTDHAETNFFDEKDLKSIKKILPKNPNTPKRGHHVCPHDRTPLEPLSAESVPKNTKVFHCNTCSGNWFPQGELQKFKKAQIVKVNYFKLWGIPLHSIYTVILPLLVLAILTTGMIGGIIGVQRRQTQQIQATDAINKPSVITISKTEVLIVFTTKTKATSQITYWKVKKEKITKSISTMPQTTHSIRLMDLEKGDYSYTLSVQQPDKPPITTQEYRFKVE